MIDIKISANDLEVILSGRCNVSTNEKLKFHFPENDPVEIQISFLNNGNERKISWKNEEYLLDITFENFNHVKNSGIHNPWYIGSFDNRELFMTIFFHHIKDTYHDLMLCDYTFYLGKEEEDEE